LLESQAILTIRYFLGRALSGMMSKEEEKADKGEDQEIKDDAHGEW
jgi:hypothetical protein